MYNSDLLIFVIISIIIQCAECTIISLISRPLPWQSLTPGIFGTQEK